MEPFGACLKKAREKKGLSLEQVASKTRIPESRLHALESEDFANLPAKVFAKGFVRSYAKTLGLDEEETLQRFLEASDGFYAQVQSDSPHVQVTLEAARQPIVSWKLILIIVAVIAIGVIGAIWSWFPQQQKAPIALPEPEVSSPIKPIQESIPPSSSSEEGISPAAPIDSVPAQSSSPAPVPTASQPKPMRLPTVKPVLSTSPIPAIEKTTDDGSQILEIEATQLTWVVVQSDQHTPKEALLQPGQRITWKADKQFLLTLGNAAGVLIRLNGEPQGPFGKPGQVVREIRLRP
jgi:cytoskeleton protein RodZ